MSSDKPTEDTFSFPEHGITCFHCGETFTKVGTAQDHFGGSLFALAACQIKVGAERGLLMALRKSEAELATHVDDDSAVMRELYSMQVKHSDQLRVAEEAGYERGLKDYSALDAKLTTANETIARLEQQKADVTADYMRRHKDATDRFEEIIGLKEQLATKEADAERFLRMAERDHSEMYSDYWADADTTPDDLREVIDARARNSAIGAAIKQQ